MKKLVSLKVSDIEPDPEQPRKDFREDVLKELAESIKEQGLKTPISVRAHPNKRFGGPSYMIIAGERRWRAHQLAEIQMIDAILEEGSAVDPDAIFAHQLIENIQREDLNPVEKAEFVAQRIEYHREKGIERPNEAVAKELGKSPSWVSKTIQILKYSPEVREVALKGKLRDYSLLKKIEGLSPAKKHDALEQIRAGDFNAKEFFKRKRYDRKPAGSKQEGKGGAVAGGASKAKEVADLRLPVAGETWLKIMASTDYASLLDRDVPDWREKGADEIKPLINKFLAWVADTKELQVANG